MSSCFIDTALASACEETFNSPRSLEQARDAEVELALHHARDAVRRRGGDIEPRDQPLARGFADGVDRELHPARDRRLVHLIELADLRELEPGDEPHPQQRA